MPYIHIFTSVAHAQARRRRRFNRLVYSRASERHDEALLLSDWRRVARLGPRRGRRAHAPCPDQLIVNAA